MVRLVPFRALRYNLQQVGDLGRVLAPPYDVISPEQQDRLYQASPHNVVRLIFGTQGPEDTEASNRYTRAKQDYDQWRSQGVLVRDSTPAIYLVEHSFLWQQQTLRRLGVLALLQFEGSTILRHENTFEGPKADRAKLLDAVRANLDPVFCIAPDPTRDLFGVLDAHTRRPPLASALFQGDRLRLWAISELETMGAISTRLSAQNALIADGHHRFEAAASRRDLSPAVMTYFALREDPGLVMRPIHRVLSLEASAMTGVRAQTQHLCRLDLMDSPRSLLAWLNAQEGPGRFGFADATGCYAATVREDVLAEWLASPSVPSGLAELDVSILHQGLLLNRMAIATSKEVCRYTPDHEQAIAMARQQGGCAWLLRPIPLSQVFSVAGAGFALPQKSTYFYPKVLSGLVINPFDDD